MVILMASQSGTAGESLLAIRVRTFVRSFAGMNAPVSCERARVTKGLFKVNILILDSQNFGKYLPFRNARTYGASRQYALSCERSKQTAG
jgi:hypothetical protein